MIVIGYQGIGKSTFAENHDNAIDLESGNFWVDGERALDWYIPYCNIAEDLSSQGNLVFVSSHEAVRNRLKESAESVLVIVPDVSLKNKWVEKLKRRYEDSKLTKDYKAWMNAADRYEENIKEMLNDGFETIAIDKINYDLSELLKNDLICKNR